MNSNISTEKLMSGDRREFDAFYRQSFPLFFSFACNFLSDRETCRDIVQDVFLRYWLRHGDFDDLVSIKVFFYRSIRNGCINHISHHKARENYLRQRQYAAEDDQIFLDAIIVEEIAFAIHRKIGELSPMGRKVLTLAMQGDRNEEIAEKLSVSVNTVKTHKLRAYSVLRKQLAALRCLIAALVA